LSQEITVSRRFASRSHRRSCGLLLVALVVLGASACSGDDDASTDTADTTAAPTVTANPDSTETTDATTATVGGGGGKVLVADGSHWGCPGTFCGPTVSRLSDTRFDPADAVTVQRGERVDAECHTTGSPVTDDVTDTTTDEWIRIGGVDDGHVWMSAHYFGTADFTSVLDGLPPC